MNERAGELFTQVDMALRTDRVDVTALLQPVSLSDDVLKRLWNELGACLWQIAVETTSHPYAQNAVDLFFWFLEPPHRLITRSVCVVWQLLTAAETLFPESEAHGYRMAVLVACHLNPNGQVLREILERFEQGVIAPSHADWDAAQQIAALLQFAWIDIVKLEETEELPPAHDTFPWETEEHRDERPTICIDHLLGEYVPGPDKCTLRLYMKGIRSVATFLGQEVDVLKRIVRLHEAAHAVIHHGRDADGMSFSDEDFAQIDQGIDPSPLHEMLAQLLCYHAVKTNEGELACFQRLGAYQPAVYTLWSAFQEIPLEDLRAALRELRRGTLQPTYAAFAEALMLHLPSN